MKIYVRIKAKCIKRRKLKKYNRCIRLFIRYINVRVIDGYSERKKQK